MPEVASKAGVIPPRSHLYPVALRLAGDDGGGVGHGHLLHLPGSLGLGGEKVSPLYQNVCIYIVLIPT